jgi:hypothetical protein
VQGLQRGFHEAGVRNVVSSLWSVSDAATSVLMEEMYRQLWQKKLPAIAALRQAQLFVLKNPQRVVERARELHELLVKRGVSEEVLQSRGISKKAGTLPKEFKTGKRKRSPTACGHRGPCRERRIGERLNKMSRASHRERARDGAQSINPR